MAEDEKQTMPPQTQEQQPGKEHEMTPEPRSEAPFHRGSGKLEGKVALITGGDSGIGRAVAVAFAKEGAHISVIYLNEHEDAQKTKSLLESEGGTCTTIAGDIGDEAFCKDAVQKTVNELQGLDILVNNAAEQHPRDDIEEISAEQLQQTFRTNIFSMFYLTKAALPHLHEGSKIINTTSVTAYRGSAHLVDYASTKGAIVAFTRSLALMLAPRRIRVNAVAPGPIWTPLIPATFTEEQVKQFGADVPLGRPGQPEEVAPAYVFLASEDSSYITGQTIHPNGGEIING